MLLKFRVLRDKVCFIYIINMENIKVLFFSANPATMSLVPPVIALFYSIFKKNNIEMRYFDTQAYDTSALYADPNVFLHSTLMD